MMNPYFYILLNLGDISVSLPNLSDNEKKTIIQGF